MWSRTGGYHRFTQGRAARCHGAGRRPRPSNISKTANPSFRARAESVLHIGVLFIMLLCMRTTIELNDEILRQAKRRAADERVPLRQVIEAALRAHLAGRFSDKANYSLRWRPETGRFRSGVRLDDRDALFDLMEERT